MRQNIQERDNLTVWLALPESVTADDWQAAIAIWHRHAKRVNCVQKCWRAWSSGRRWQLLQKVTRMIWTEVGTSSCLKFEAEENFWIFPWMAFIWV